MLTKRAPKLNLKLYTNIVFTLFVLSSLFALFSLIGENPRKEENAGLETYVTLYFECFVGIIIVIIWISISKEYKHKRSDWGLGWLALAILVWSVRDNLNIYIGCERWVNNCLSIVNVTCFLFAAKYLSLEEETALEFFFHKKLNINRVIAARNISTNKAISAISLIILSLNIVFGLTIPELTFTLFGIHFLYSVIPAAFLLLSTIVIHAFFFVKVFNEKQFFRMNILVMITLLVTLMALFINLLADQSTFFEIRILYRPLVIVLYFTVTISLLRLEKEKMAQMQTRDMNHAVRGTLNILCDDIENTLDEIREESTDTAIDLLEEIKLRIQSMYDLHNLVHEERRGKLYLNAFLYDVVANIKKGLQYKERLVFDLKITRNIKSTRTQLRKISSILLELAINASKVANKINKRHNKELRLTISEGNNQLRIIAMDNGTHFKKSDKNKGYGLERLYSIVEDDLMGSITYNSNSLGGTTFEVEIPMEKIKSS